MAVVTRKVIMTEQEYIIAGDRRTISHVIDLLQRVIPENDQCVPASEKAVVMGLLFKWLEDMQAVKLIEGD
jgi:hypothetical protein